MSRSRLCAPVVLTAALSGVLGLTGCGGPARGTGVPRPATAPPVTRAPAGTVVALPGDPEGLAVDVRDGILAAGVRDPDGVALISLTTGHVHTVIHLAAVPQQLALENARDLLLVPLAQAGQLVKLALPSGQVASRTPVGRHPQDAVAATGGIVFVTNTSSSTVSLLQHGQQVAEEPAPQQPSGVAAGPKGTEVVVVGGRAHRVEEFTSSGWALGSTSAGAGPTSIVAGGNNLFYVADTAGDAIGVFLVGAGPRRVATVPTRAGAPYGLALDRTRGVLYVTLTASNELESFKLKGNTVVPAHVWPTVRQPDSVAVDSATGRIFVASRTGGGLQLIDP